MTLIVNSIMTDPPKGGLKRPTKKPANQTPNSVYTTDTTSVEIGKKVEKPKTEKTSNKQNELIKNKTIENVGNGIYKAKSKFENGELVEQYYKLEDGFYSRVENNNGTWQAVQNEKSLSAQELKDAVDCANATKKYINNSAKNSYEKYINETGNSAKVLWKLFFKSDNTNKINSVLSGINQGNIVDFLDDYYTSSSYKKNNDIGMMQMLDLYSSKTDNMAERKQIIQALLNVAAALNMSDTEQYKNLNNLYVEYTVGFKKNEQDMLGDATNQGWASVGIIAAGGVSGAAMGTQIGTVCGLPGMAGGAIIGFVVGVLADGVMIVTKTGPFMTPTDSELVDEYMYKLHKAIKERLNQNAINYRTNPVNNSDKIRETNMPKQMMGTYEA